MTHNNTCINKKNKIYRVAWDYHNPEFSGDYESITFDDKCEVCNTEFQSTYSNPLLSIISKITNEVTNFNYMVEIIN